jgi:ABC-type sugar transport system permease subunit/ABC-type glycerol-3-phosphate transport system substrate-binding protein
MGKFPTHFGRLFAAAVMLFAAAAERAAGAEAGQMPVHLRLEVPASDMRGPATAAETAVLDAFERANPNVQIDPYVRLRMQGPQSEATLYMSMAGQTAPDALNVNGRSMQQYIEQRFLYPLDSYLTDDVKRDPAFIRMLPTVSHDGHIYGIPARVYVHALLYRKDLFAAAGLDPDHPPTTWNELLADARKLTRPTAGQFGIELPSGVNAGWRFADFVWQAGGEMVRPRPDGGWRLSLDEPQAIAALQFYKDLRWGQYTAADGTEQQGCMRVDETGDSQRDLLEGRCAMTIVSTTGDVGRMIPDPASYGIAPLPAGPGGPATMLEGEFWGLNASIANDTARRDAAWRYVQFVTSDQAKRIQTRVFVESGAATGVPPDWLARFGYSAELRAMPHAWLDFSAHILEEGRVEPFVPGYDQVATTLLAQLDQVLYSPDADPAAVLKGINGRGNAAYFFDIPPQVVASRRHAAREIAGVVVLVAVAIGIWALRRAARQRSSNVVSQTFDAPRAADRKRLNRLGLLFLSPAILTILVWDYYPLLRGAVLAFMDYRVMGGSRFVGLDNFIAIFTEDSFWRALTQTFVYVSLSLGVGFLLPIILALLLSEITWGKIFFRCIFYLPAVTSSVIVLSVWRVMLYDESAGGVLNVALAWMTGTVPGRMVTIGAFLLVWWGLASLLACSAIDAIAYRTDESNSRPRWPILPLVTTASTFILLPIGLPLAHFELSPLNFALPMVFLIEGAIAAAVIAVASAAMIWMLGPAAQARLRRGVVFGSGVVALLLGAKLYPLLAAPMHPYPWLQDPTGYWAMLWVLVPTMWAGMGPGCIIYLAALKSIPEELYEAADLDGAGPLAKAFHITFRSLMPLIIINFVGAVIGSFHEMENVLVLTGGGPGDRTMTLGMDIFFNAFTHLRFGYATAEAWIMGSLLIGFTVYQLRTLRRMRFRTARS